MQSTLQLVATLTLALGSAAQSAVVFPARAAAVEGDEVTDLPFAMASGRFQQCTVEAVGMPLSARAMSFRRDGRYWSFGGRPRTITLELAIGNGDFAVFSSRFAANFVAAPTVVIGRRRVALPDWTPPPGGGPEPFSLRLPFNRPYTHDPRHALVWDVTVTANTLTEFYPLDFDNSGQRVVVASRRDTQPTGCKTSTSPPSRTFSAAFPVVLRTSTGQLLLTVAPQYGPPLSPVTLLVGLSDPNLSLPGLCVPIRAAPDLTFPLGTTTARGWVPFRGLVLGRYDPRWQGAKLHFQMVAPDPTQRFPIALSNASEATLPAPSSRPVTLMRTFARSATATNGVDPWDGGVVFRIEP